MALSKQVSTVAVHPAESADAMLPKDLDVSALTRTVTLDNETALAPIAAGDRLLRAIAKMFLELKGRDEICGRFNADRFMLLLSQEHRTANYDHLVETGQQMLSTAKNTVMKWGVYEVASEGVSVEQMCDRAFLAADSIRGQYNAHFSVYDDSLRSKLLREQVITESMEAALAQRQFQVYLQPKFSLLDDRLAGAEALVRWTHPEMGFLSPGEFIPLFEKNGSAHLNIEL